MAVPDFQTLLRPALEAHTGGDEIQLARLRQMLAERFELSDQERTELLPSGRQRRFDNRVGWAVTYLVKAGLLERPRRGATRITDQGRQLLAGHHGPIDLRVLDQFEGVRRFRGQDPADHAYPAASREEAVADDATPEEAIEQAHQQLTSALADDLLAKILEADPDFFEQLVVDVLIAMGYGGSKADAGERLGASGDGGIDGIIREDRLGLDAIYLQAKRWDPDRTVGRPEVQAFAGALQGARAAKGVFLTTAEFSRQATEFAESINARVVLIGGNQLTRLMIEHGVGVAVRQTYDLKRIDEDYFTTPFS